MLLPSSSSESEISVHCDSSDTNDLRCGDSSTSSQADSALLQVLHVRQYVVVKVYGEKMTFWLFVAEILSGPDEDRDYEVKFMKSSSIIKQGFYFPEDEDLASAKRSDIVLLLEPPTAISTTKCLAGVFKFTTNMSKYRL